MPVNKSCYMCDAPATCDEHAPPKCFFPEAKDIGGRDLRRNLITVRSCDDHNTSRSKDDEYAMVVTVAHHGTNQLARNQFAGKVIRALRRSPKFTRIVFHKHRPVPIGRALGGLVEVHLERFYHVMDHTCRALVFHHSGHKLRKGLHTWSTAFRHPDLSPALDESALAFDVRRRLKGNPWLGENPDAFRYQLEFVPSRSFAAIRLLFYGGFHVYAVTIASPRAA